MCGWDFVGLPCLISDPELALVRAYSMQHAPAYPLPTPMAYPWQTCSSSADWYVLPVVQTGSVMSGQYINVSITGSAQEQAFTRASLSAWKISQYCQASTRPRTNCLLFRAGASTADERRISQKAPRYLSKAG